MSLVRICILLFIINVSRASKPPTVVLDLNEKFTEVKDDGFWIVKFYAPWCAHCKRLAPTWEHVGHALQDKNLPIRVAKMDCTRFPSACNSLEVRGYPTIIFFRNGRRIEYNGERTKEALVSFCLKSSAPVVEVVNAVRLNEVRRDSRNDPSFLIVGDEKDDMLKEFQETADFLFSKTRFFSAKSESVPSALRDSGARVAVFKDDMFLTYQGDAEGLRKWIMKERWSLIPRATHSNIADMATANKYLVLSVVSEMERYNLSSPIGIFFEKVTGAANDLRKAEHLWDMFQFAWLDGPEIASNIVMGSMEPPALLVFNYSAYEYYMSYDDPEKMTRSSIVTWLDQLADGIVRETAVPMGGRSWLTRLRRMAFELYSNVAQMFATQPLLSSCLFGVPIAFLSIICYSICSADFSVDRDEFFQEEDEYLEDEELDEEHVADPNHQKNE